MRQWHELRWCAALLVATACATAEQTPPVVARNNAEPAPIAMAEPLAQKPEVAPEPTPEPTPEPPIDPGWANVDPGDDQVVGPPEAIADCEARLTAAGVHFRAGSIPVKSTKSGMICGAPQIVIYETGPTAIRWNAQPVVTCQLALALARFETLLQEEAEKNLGARVTRIQQGGTYSCRKMARFKSVSEHSYANAIDLRAFELSDHRTITVKRHFGPLDSEPDKPESRFLRTVARRAFDEKYFSVVVTPFWDKLHADHFHVDQAHYRVGSVGPSSRGD